MIVVNLLFIISAVFLIILGKYPNKAKDKRFSNQIQKFINRNYKFIILALFALIVLTSIYELKNIPYGLHVDEAGMAYDAISLTNFGMDRYLNKYPVYLINYGGGQSALYAYLAAILIKIFGYSKVIIRMPIVIIRLLLSVAAFYIIKDEESKTKNILLLSLLAISPYFIMQSRWGLDCNLLVGLVTIAICFFTKAIKKNSNILFIISGIMFGLSLYTYALSYLIMPLFLGIICIYLLVIKKVKFKQLVIFGIPLAILALPLMLMILVNNGIIDQINSFITIPKMLSYRGSEISIKNVFHNFYIFMTIFTFDNPFVFGKWLVYNATWQFGTIYYFTIPFAIIGAFYCFKNCIKSVKEKKFNNAIVFSVLFTCVIVCQLLICQPNINKANAVFIALIYFSVQGIYEVIKNRKSFAIIICSCLAINFMMFSNYYLKHYNDDNMDQYLFATCYLDALEYSKNLKKDYVYIDDDIAAEQYIYILLDNNISPYEFNKENIKTAFEGKNINYIMGIPSDISKDAVYIVKGNNANTLNKFKSLGFKNQKNCNIVTFYHE